MDTVKYYLHLHVEPNLMASIRVYRDDPRKHGGAGSIEAVRMINYDTGQLDPAKVRFNVGFSNRDGYGYPLDEVDGIIDWINEAKHLANSFDHWIKEVLDFERVVLEPMADFDVLYFDEVDGKIVIHYPEATMENVRPGQ